MYKRFCLNRGRILWWNSDKSLKSFPPCYSKAPLQHCREISISSYSRNLWKREMRKTWQKPIPNSLWFKKSIQKPQVPRTLKIIPRAWIFKESMGARNRGGRGLSPGGINSLESIPGHHTRLKIRAQKPQWNCTFMNSASVSPSCSCWSFLKGTVSAIFHVALSMITALFFKTVLRKVTQIFESFGLKIGANC